MKKKEIKVKKISKAQLKTIKGGKGTRPDDGAGARLTWSTGVNLDKSCS